MYTTIFIFNVFLFVAAGTETLAVAQGDGSYRLYGYKWFSSATDSDMTITLARIVKRDGSVEKVIRLIWFT